MTQRKLNSLPKAVTAALITASLMLVLILLLSAGGVYARYYTVLTKDASFNLQPKQTVYLFSARDEAGTGDVWLEWVKVTTDDTADDTTDVITDETNDGMADEMTEVTTDVPTNVKTQTMSVCISNSDMIGGNTIDEDTAVHLRLYLKETPELADDQPDPRGNMMFTLRLEGEDVEYTASSEYLRLGSALYKEKGAGWIYCFEDETGNELTHFLEGGVQSDVNVILTVYDTNEKISEFVELLIDQQNLER